MTAYIRAVGQKIRRVAIPIAAAFAVLVPLGMAASPANAYIVDFHQGNFSPQGVVAGYSDYNYRATLVYGGDWTGAGAHVSGSWAMYGSMATGWTFSCHVYAAGNTLGGMMMNASTSVVQWMRGTMYVTDQYYGAC